MSPESKWFRTRWLSGERCHPASGVATLIFIALILPFMAVMLSVTVDFARFFSIRDELQRVTDGEVFEALARGLSAQEVERNIRTRMRNVDGIIELSEVFHTRGQARRVVGASANYSGVFFQFVQEMIGTERRTLPINVSSTARIQSASSLIIIDRTVGVESNPCDDLALQAVGSFTGRVVANWGSIANAKSIVGVTPGVSEALELVSSNGSDEIPRCGQMTSSQDAGFLNFRGVQGGLIDPLDLAFAAREIASTELFSQVSEVRSIVLVLRRSNYDLGVAQALYNLLRESAHDLNFSVDFYTLVIDDSQTINNRPLNSGINGGIYREIGASVSEFLGDTLVAALTKTVTDRVVLEN